MLVEVKQIYMRLDSVFLLMPQVILLLVAVWILLGDAFAPKRRSTWPWLAIAGIGISAAFLKSQMDILWERGTGPHSSGPLTIDLFGHLLQILILVVGLLLVLMTFRSPSQKQPAEYLGSVLVLVAGLMTVCVANELVLLFVALELVSIPTYVLLYIGQRAGKSGADGASESTVKYFFLSILSSAVLLYGFSFLYGIAGSTELSGIRFALDNASEGSMANYLAPVALVLIVAGLAFKLTIVPFHFYAPDVFQGTTHTNAGLLAVAPKIAGIVALVRVVYAAMPGSEHLAWHLMLALAMLTMTLGNLLALWQRNIRRMLAYSSIAHAGYMLIGVTVALAVAGQDAVLSGGLNGLSATTFYLLVYCIGTVGTFSVLAYLSGKNRQLNQVDELAGVATSHPGAAAALAACMFSLAGVPIMAGFWGKLTLITAALGVSTPDDPGMTPLRIWFIALAFVGVINAAIAAAYYLRLVAVAYFRPQQAAPECQGGIGTALSMTLCSVALLVIGVMPGPTLSAANQASNSVRSVLEPQILPDESSDDAEDATGDEESEVALQAR